MEDNTGRLIVTGSQKRLQMTLMKIRERTPDEFKLKMPCTFVNDVGIVVRSTCYSEPRYWLRTIVFTGYLVIFLLEN